MTFDSFRRKVEASGLTALNAAKHWTIQGGYRTVYVYNRLSGLSYMVKASGEFGRIGIKTDDAIRAALTHPTSGKGSQKTKFKDPKNTKRRHLLWERDRGMCHWCLRTLQFVETTVDHLLKSGETGREHPDNQVCSCAPCNSIRGHRDPKTFRKLRTE